jgi:hypothetical protein
MLTTCLSAAAAAAAAGVSQVVVEAAPWLKPQRFQFLQAKLLR